MNCCLQRLLETIIILPLQYDCLRGPKGLHAPPHGRSGSLHNGPSSKAEECIALNLVHNLVIAAPIQSY